MRPDQLLGHLKRLASSLTARQIATLAAAFIGVVGVVAGSAYWMNTPTYSLFYSDLDAESAAAVVARLQDQNVPYVLADGGRSVRIPQERIDELRLGFASEGLPATGRIGFEIFDRVAFGTTEFLEKVNYRRGLEGELARTIGTIKEVASARVHIALARDSLFTGEASQAKASVVLKLRNAKPLAPPTIAGIAGLVAASVESLRPEAVVIVDTFGRPLSRIDAANAPGNAASVERQQQIERDLTTKVVAMLEPVLGPGRVRVNVAATLDPNSEEETVEQWDPSGVIRSQQSTTDVGQYMGTPIVAGARGNTTPTASTAPPDQTADAETPGTPSQTIPSQQPPTKSSETTNFEISKVTRHTIAPPGEIARLSVAVLVDDERSVGQDANGQPQTTNTPREPQELERIKGLVAAAVGFNQERGDQLTVENIAFEEPPAEPEAPPEGIGQQVVTGLQTRAWDITRIVVVLVLALVAFLSVLRPIVRSALSVPQLAPAPAGAIQPPVRTVADLEGEIEAEIDAELAAKNGGSRKLPVLSKRIAKQAGQDPEHVARLVRTLMTEDR